MQTAAQVSFDDIPLDEAVREAALRHIGGLESVYDRITGCHVVIAQPHRHKRDGRLYSVRINLVVPGGEIVVNRNHPLDHAHEDVYVAMRDSFDAARRQLEDHVRHLRGAVKPHALPAVGRVTQVFPLQGYGFLATPDGREIYFHQHAISEHDFRMLEIGSEVHFSEEEGDQGPQAAHVQLVHPRTHATRRGHV